MTTNIRDVAKYAGVSVATVSRALHGTQPVAGETLQRIQEAIRALQYEPKAPPQRSSEPKPTPLRRTRSIGLVLGDIFRKFSDPYWAGVLDGVKEELRQQRYHLRFTFTMDDVEQEYQRRLLTHAHIDGLIMIAKQLYKPVIHEIAPEYTVTVEYGWPVPLRFDNIESEKRQAMHTLIDHLISLGHRRFRFCTGEREDERTYAVFEALTRHNIPFPPDFCWQGSWETEEAYPMILELLQREGREIDVLVCASDMIAVAAMRAANVCGLRVPHDIAITGFDDFPFVRDLDPPLTTIAVPTEQLGRMAVRKLIERIQHPDLPPAYQVLPTQLVVRRSCGAGLHDKAAAPLAQLLQTNDQSVQLLAPQES